MKLMKYISWIGYALLIVSVIIILSFFISSDFNAEIFPQADVLLKWTYVMCFLAMATAVLLPLVNMVSNPKGMLRSFAGFGVVLAVVLICYLMADTTPLTMVGGDVITDASQLVVSDTGLFATYAAFGAACLAIIAGEIYQIIKK